MNYYLIKYRVTTTNAISNVIVSFDNEESADAAYYKEIADANTNNKLQYCMLCLLDDKYEIVKNITISSPGRISSISNYKLIFNTTTITKETSNEIFAFNSMDEVQNKIDEYINEYIDDTQIYSVHYVVLNQDNKVAKDEEISCAGNIKFDDKYLLISFIKKVDGNIENKIIRHDSIESAVNAAYSLLSQSIDNINYLFIHVKIIDSKSNCRLDIKEYCKGKNSSTQQEINN